MPVVLITVCVFSFLIILHVLLVLHVSNKTGLSNTLEKQFDSALTQRKRAEEVNQKVGILQDKLNVVRKIIKPDINWSKLLSGLNQSMVSGIWLHELDVKFAPNRAENRDFPVLLNLRGYAIGGSGAGTSLVAKFIVSLKSNPDFYVFFDDIELDSMENREYAGEEVMRFKLDCKFKEPEQVVTGSAQIRKNKKLRR
jgi:hypothetical protein